MRFHSRGSWGQQATLREYYDYAKIGVQFIIFFLHVNSRPTFIFLHLESRPTFILLHLENRPTFYIKNSSSEIFLRFDYLAKIPPTSFASLAL